MTGLTIDLDPIALREATSQAIMGVLTPEVRERVLCQAISVLLTPSTDIWDKKKSPMELAFERAVSVITHDLAREYIKNDPEIMKQLGELLHKTAEKIVSMDVDKMAERMADAFVSSMRRE